MASEATVQRDKDRKAAWAAVRCAAAVGQAIRSRLLLTGKNHYINQIHFAKYCVPHVRFI